MQKWLVGLIVIIIIVGVSLAAVHLLQKGFVVETMTPMSDPPEHRMEVPGEVRVITVEKVFAAYSGLIETVRVKPGDEVIAGQTLLTYATDSWQRELVQTRLELQTLRNNIDHLQKSYEDTLRQRQLDVRLREDALKTLDLQEQELEKSIGDYLRQLSLQIEDARVAVAAQQKELAKVEALFAAGAIPRKDVDNAREKLKQLTETLDRRQVEYKDYCEETAPMKRAALQDRIAQARRALEDARGLLLAVSTPQKEKKLLEDRMAFLAQEVLRLEKTLSRPDITAPCSGKILSVLPNPGQQVARGAELLQIGDTAQTKVVLLVPSGLWHRLTPEQWVEVYLEDTSFPLRGTIAWIAPHASQDTVETHIDLEFGHESLRPGMKVRAEIIAPRENVLILPPQAVVARKVPSSMPVVRKDEETLHYVFVVDTKTRKVSPQRVRVGLSGPGYIEVISGLRGDSQVVVGDTAALERLKAQLAEWERKDIKEIRAVFDPVN